MSELEKNLNTELSDEEMQDAAGGKGFRRCDHGKFYESAFPERGCKNCKYFSCKTNATGKKYSMTCGFFGRTENKNVDWWDLG